VDTTPSKILACIQFQSLPRFLLDVWNHSGSPHGLVWVFAPSFLDRSTNKFLHVDLNATIAAMFWLCIRSSLRVYMLYSLCEHPSHSHMKLYALSHKYCHSHWRSITSIVLVTHTFNQSCWVYVVLMVWGVLSSSHVDCVFARSPMHKFTYSHT